MVPEAPKLIIDRTLDVLKVSKEGTRAALADQIGLGTVGVCLEANDLAETAQVPNDVSGLVGLCEQSNVVEPLSLGKVYNLTEVKPIIEPYIIFHDQDPWMRTMMEEIAE
ncbi:hypothetical protein GCM10011385_07430 [Nitratireductor aestuarii]|uniref:Uncharacterized protein n=1 Tax=Nitratireductor aestuarii TaxID=1735103 RepID=A0A916VZV6_9HYPH|nr:hypothetical protein GCM10011385_07430 [Nitratireductor aestuarii]